MVNSKWNKILKSSILLWNTYFHLHWNIGIPLNINIHLNIGSNITKFYIKTEATSWISDLESFGIIFHYLIPIHEFMARMICEPKEI